MTSTPHGTVRGRRRDLFALAAACLLLLVASAPAGGPVAPSGEGGPERAVVSRFDPYAGREVVEVWACHVPQETRVADYHPVPMRVAIDPAALAPLLDEHVGDYFGTLSNGVYRPAFVAGGALELTADEGPHACLARAAASSSASATAVLAIADAEHRADTHGGYGTIGEPCASAPSPCPARESGRGAYVGASDFHPAWGPLPAFDLVEHELGHALGWPHSSGGGGSYDSALDLMSDSTAPRAVDSDELHAGGTLGVNRLASGWIPPGDVAVAPADGTTTTATLAPSASASGTRLLVLPLGEARALTVELLVAKGLDRHLPVSGIAITRVDATAASCGTPCDPMRRLQVVARGAAPYTDLLEPADGPWSGHGWRVEVTALDDGRAVVAATRTGSGPAGPFSLARLLGR